MSHDHHDHAHHHGAPDDYGRAFAIGIALNLIYVAAQAASNGRSHAHNDSGSFILFHNGNPIFIDVGPEAYTAKTFSKDRYSLWTMQSAFHNLPTIGDVMQHDGTTYRAGDLDYSSDDARATFRANLAPAYPPEAAAASGG